MLTCGADVLAFTGGTWDIRIMTRCEQPRRVLNGDQARRTVSAVVTRRTA